VKSRLLFKTLFAITGLLLHFNLWAQDVPPITLHVETAGTLPSLIAESRKYVITDLTLTGNLNGTDIKFIREMAGRNYYGNTTDGKLAVLNLAGANIVSGGDSYYESGIYAHHNTYTNSISYYMFYQCTGLTSVTIPNSVTSIGSYAFYRCTGLTSVTIPNSVTSIGDGVFYDCTGLTSVTIPNSVTSIGQYAFWGCTGLTSVTIGNSVTSIGQSAFVNCTGLTNVTIPNSVTSIGQSAFGNCTGLTSVTIPNSVTSIGQYAFGSCTGLTNVTIPNSITSIGQYAFLGCTGLTEIHSKNPTPPTVSLSSFSGVKSACKLYVPKGSYGAYWIAPGWSSFNNIIEEDDNTAIVPVNNDNTSIRSISNGIAVETKETTPVEVYNFSGQKVYQSVITGNAEIRLQKGIYIVRVNNKSEKIIVK
jgi:hypothetical protein